LIGYALSESSGLNSPQRGRALKIDKRDLAHEEATLAIKRIPIHSMTTGSSGRNEDRWTLLIDSETGNRSVEHEWSYVTPHGRGQRNSGETVSLFEFLAGDADASATVKLLDLLKKGV
jgi:hypothetical protein